VRFRHKLSIVLVGLAIVPLVAAGLIVQALLAGDEVRSVDSKLSAGAAGAAAAYRAQLEVAETLAVQMAGRPDVARAFVRRDGSGVDLSAVPSGYSVALADDRGTFAGSVPEGTVWSTTARLRPEAHDRRVIVSLPLDTDTLLRVQSQSPVAEGVGLALVVGGRSIASIGGPAGPATGLRSGQAADARIGTTDVRAQAVEVQGPGRPAQLVADYPSSRIADRIDAVRLKLLIPLAVLAGIVAACALLAADRISRALVELSQRALALVRSESPLPRGGGDELEELNVALDTMSGQLSDRMSELESERARLKATLARYGETLAATHDLRALLGAVLDTAVQATKARGGRLLLYDVERGEATEQVRLGTARGSRADLPMVVPAGHGLEGEALLAQQPRWSAAPRPLVAVPIVREQNLLGVVTVVDPAEGSFGPDDVETLAGLAVQAGVAIENGEPTAVLRGARPGVRARPPVRHAAVADPARHRRLQADQRHASDEAPGRGCGARRGGRRHCQPHPRHRPRRPLRRRGVRGAASPDGPGGCREPGRAPAGRDRRPAGQLRRGRPHRGHRQLRRGVGTV
jgi:hypothetical protein